MSKSFENSAKPFELLRNNMCNLININLVVYQFSLETL